MLVTNSVGPSNVFGNATKQFKNTNFIMHEAVEVCGKAAGQVKSMNYYLPFFNPKANSIKNHTRMWVTEYVMMELLTHTNKNIKQVFDKTIIYKLGWVECSPMSTLSQVSHGCL